MHCPGAVPRDRASWWATVQPTPDSAPHMLTVHPWGASALGLVAILQQDSVPGPLHSPALSGADPDYSSQYPPLPLFG